MRAAARGIALQWAILHYGQGDLCRLLDHKVGHGLPAGERLDVLECMSQQRWRQRISRRNARVGE
eukprot:scaffold24914_cov70-Phaeocystis_antarctica.AAC.8